MSSESLQHSEDVRSLKMTLIIYLFIFAMKLVVYFMSGVMALLAEAMHTFSDILISAFLLAAVLFSRKKADATHMYGHGRAQYAAALVAATMFISFTSYELYQAAIPRLFEPEVATHQNLPLVLGVLIVSMIIAAAPLVTLFRQKTRGAAAKAQLTELFNDQLGLLAAFVGTLFIMWNKPIADPLAANVVATIIAINAVKMFRENLTALLGSSPGKEYLAQLERTARSVPGVLGLHDLRAEIAGQDIVHAEMHIEVQPGTLIEEADRIAEEVQRRLETEAGLDFCAIHVDPAPIPASPEGG
jgi:cation diffusion facilitator family transporter